MVSPPPSPPTLSCSNHDRYCVLSVFPNFPTPKRKCRINQHHVVYISNYILTLTINIHETMFLLSISHTIVMLTDLSSLPFNINIIFYLFSHAKLGRCLRVPEKRLYIVIYFSFFLEICVLNCNSYAIDHAQIYFHAHMNSFL